MRVEHYCYVAVSYIKFDNAYKLGCGCVTRSCSKCMTEVSISLGDEACAHEGD